MTTSTTSAVTPANSAPSIVIYGPPGCGKSKHAEELRAYLDLDTVVDDWDGSSPYPRVGALVLTSNPSPTLAPSTHAMHFGSAMRELNSEGRRA